MPLRKISAKVSVYSRSWGTDRQEVLGKHCKDRHWRAATVREIKYRQKTDKQDQTHNNQPFVQKNLFTLSRTAARWDAGCGLQDQKNYRGARQGPPRKLLQHPGGKRPGGLYHPTSAEDACCSRGRSEVLRGWKKQVTKHRWRFAKGTQHICVYSCGLQLTTHFKITEEVLKVPNPEYHLRRRCSNYPDMTVTCCTLASY